MARKLTEWPDDLPVRSTQKYPLDQWFDGSVWELVQGQDFTCKYVSLRTALQAKAREHKGAIRIALMEDGKRAVLQFRKVPTTEGE